VIRTAVPVTPASDGCSRARERLVDPPPVRELIHTSRDQATPYKAADETRQQQAHQEQHERARQLGQEVAETVTGAFEDRRRRVHRRRPPATRVPSAMLIASAPTASR
jgi:hypothetical protein